MIHAFDTAAVHALQSLSTAWYWPAWTLSEIIGSTIYLAPLLILALLLIGKKRTALEVLAIFIVSCGTIYLLKHAIAAPRPFDADSTIVNYAGETGFGMPSGHALISMVTLGWVWVRHPRSLFLTLGTAFLIFMIGLSRVYLGAHYPSQVVAGWACGLLLLWLFSWMDRWLFRSRSQYVRKEGE